MVLTPAQAGLRRAAAPVSPVLRLGLPYFARVAGLGRREGSAFPGAKSSIRWIQQFRPAGNEMGMATAAGHKKSEEPSGQRLWRPGKDAFIGTHCSLLDSKSDSAGSHCGA